MKKKIGNVGELDLTAATEESIQGIQKIGNVGVILYRPETAHLVTQLSIGNLGSSVEIPEGYQLLRGNLTIDHDYLHQLKEPLYVHVSGKVMICNDVTAEDIEEKIGEIRGNGKIFFPKKVAGFIKSRLTNMSGKIKAYPDNAQHFSGTVTINQSFLNALAAESTLFIDGALMLIDDVAESLLQEKIVSIDILGKAVVKEDHAPFLREKLADVNSCKLEVVPTGHIYIDEGIQLDEVSIRRFKNAKIYSPHVIIEHNVTLEMLQQHIAGIRTKGKIVCPDHLVDAVLEKIDNHATKILTYKDKVKLIKGVHSLSASELEHTQGRLTLIVYGVVKIDADLSPELILEKIDCIDNFGVIEGNRKQCGVIHTKIRNQNGVVTEAQNEEKENEENGIGNVGYLKL